MLAHDFFAFSFVFVSLGSIRTRVGTPKAQRKERKTYYKYKILTFLPHFLHGGVELNARGKREREPGRARTHAPLLSGPPRLPDRRARKKLELFFVRQE